jgi:ribonuclease HI
MNEVVIYADGACRATPARVAGAPGCSSGTHEKELFGGEKLTTNNRMELTAVIEALASLKRRSVVAIYTDSEYVKNGITTWIHGWKARGWKTADKKPVKNIELWQRLDELRGAPGAVALGQGPCRRSRQRTRRRSWPTVACDTRGVKLGNRRTARLGRGGNQRGGTSLQLTVLHCTAPTGMA